MGQEIQIKSRDGQSFAAYLALPARTPARDGYAADGFVVLAPDV